MDYFDQQNGGKVFTTAPQSGEYSAGDIWILNAARDINGVSYPQGTVLKAVLNANLELIWEDTMPDVTSAVRGIKQNFVFDPDDGLTVGQSDEQFKVKIDSTRMGLYDGDTEVVHISNKSANIDNLTVEKNFVADCDSSLNGSLTMNKSVNNQKFSFSWQIESNGSYSLVNN